MEIGNRRTRNLRLWRVDAEMIRVLERLLLCLSICEAAHVFRKMSNCLVLGVLDAQAVDPYDTEVGRYLEVR